MRCSILLSSTLFGALLQPADFLVISRTWSIRLKSVSDVEGSGRALHCARRWAGDADGSFPSVHGHAATSQSTLSNSTSRFWSKLRVRGVIPTSALRPLRSFTRWSRHPQSGHSGNQFSRWAWIAINTCDQTKSE